MLLTVVCFRKQLSTGKFSIKLSGNTVDDAFDGAKNATFSEKKMLFVSLENRAVPCPMRHAYLEIGAKLLRVE